MYKDSAVKSRALTEENGCAGLSPDTESLSSGTAINSYALQAVRVAFLDDGALEEMAQPSCRGKRRLAGLDMNKTRIRNVADALLALSSRPGGFTAEHLVEQIRARQNDQSDYGRRQAVYDLTKFIAKGLISHAPRSRYYRIRPKSIRALAA